MAVNAYLVIDTVKGDSLSKPDAIDISSFSFGASMQWSHGEGGGESRPGTANVSEVTITKSSDKCSPQLFQDCVSGNKYEKVDVIYDKAMGDKQDDFFKVHMEKAHITGIAFSGGGESPIESLSFGFDKVKISYNPEKDGKLQGWVEKGFDLSKLAEW